MADSFKFGFRIKERCPNRQERDVYDSGYKSIESSLAEANEILDKKFGYKKRIVLVNNRGGRNGR